MSRTIAYIDGFNLYFGLKSKNWRRYYWLDVQAMMGRLLKPPLELIETKYFTSRVSASPYDPDKPKRQAAYLEALESLADLRVYFGHYLVVPVTCRTCGSVDQKPTEKMTDVNIATELLCDAFADRFDVAAVLSGDSDVAPPIEAVRRLFPKKQVLVLFPPKRFSNHLACAASGTIHIGRGVLAASQFPDEVVKPNGFVLRRPHRWK